METWTADGWDITQGVVRDIEYRDGLVSTPTVQGSNLTLPGMRGERWRAKPLGSGKFVINAWVGGNSQAEAWAYFEDLLRATVRPDRLVRYERVMPDGTTRYCYGEVTSSVSPRSLGQTGYRMGIEVNVPDGLWYSKGVITQDFSLTVSSSAINQTLQLSSFSGGTAVLDRLSYRYSGAAADVRISNWTEDVADGWLRYVGPIGSSQSVLFNSDTWAVTGGGGLSVNQQGVSYSGSRLLAVQAARPGRVPKINVQASGASGSPILRVTGEKAYLC